MKDVSVVVGMGEVGKAVARVLAKTYEVVPIDLKTMCKVTGEMRVRVLHICLPWSDEFVAEVIRYRKLYTPGHTVIHSTVPVGVSRTCGALHSPIVGRHPHLAKAVEVSTRFIGGKDAGEVADYFRRAGLEVYIVDEQEETELMKLLSTLWYGVCIELTKETKRLCDKHDVPFEFFTLWTQAYNHTAEALGYPDVRRPNLVPVMKRIGGHCVLPNAELLDSRFADLLRRLNALDG